MVTESPPGVRDKVFLILGKPQGGGPRRKRTPVQVVSIPFAGSSHFVGAVLVEENEWPIKITGQETRVKFQIEACRVSGALRVEKRR